MQNISSILHLHNKSGSLSNEACHVQSLNASLRYRTERNLMSSSFLLYWNKPIGMVLLLHKDETVSSSDDSLSQNPQSLVILACLISCARATRLHRATTAN